MSRRVLITGASGFIGANLTRRLLADGHNVTILIRHSPDTYWRIKDIRSQVGITITDLTRLHYRLEQIKPDWIFHLAAYGVYPWQTDVETMLLTNGIGTIRLLNAALRVGFEAFVNAGTSLEYGRKDHPTHEGDCIEPTSDYGVSKAFATQYAQAIATRLNKPITTLRLYSPYGPYETPIRLIPTLIEHGLRGELPPMANPDNARDFVHVDDVCEAFVRAAERLTRPDGSGQIYNVGTGVQTSLRETITLSKKLMNIEAEPDWNTSENRVWDTSCWVADNAKIKRELGWQPRYTFEQGLQATIDWTREQRKVAA